jgi:hypothetical protein
MELLAPGMLRKFIVFTFRFHDAGQASKIELSCHLAAA